MVGFDFVLQLGLHADREVVPRIPISHAAAPPLFNLMDILRVNPPPCVKLIPFVGLLLQSLFLSLLRKLLIVHSVLLSFIFFSVVAGVQLVVKLSSRLKDNCT
jgi:hypothetical protein